MIQRVTATYTTDGSGAATCYSKWPVLGEICEIRQPAGGTATYTITRAETGGTILAATGLVGPFSVNPRATVVTTANAGGTAIGLIPCDEQVKVVLASGPASTAGTVHIIYRGC